MKHSILPQIIRNHLKPSELTNTAISHLSLDEYITNRVKRCNATNKTNGKQCRGKAVNGTSKCYIHGGCSTGAKTLEGKIKNLSKLKQYKNNPELFAEKVRQLRAKYDSKD